MQPTPQDNDSPTLPDEPPKRDPVPAFRWAEWYAAAGGRTINVSEVNAYMLQIREEQVPRFTGPVAPIRREFALPEEAVIQLAEYVRSLGYACQVEHPVGDSDLLHIPIALKAGFGELGRHGSVINPKLGPLFRMGSVITSIPLATDKPIDAGIAAFCEKCQLCRRHCPADAIPDHRSPEPGINWSRRSSKQAISQYSRRSQRCP